MSHSGLVRRLLRLLAASAAALALSACAPERPSEAQQIKVDEQDRASSPEAQPVAIVNGEEISVAEYERRINGLAAYARAIYATPEKKKEYLDSVVVFEMMADEAERRGLGEDPQVIHAMKEAMVRQLVQQHVREAVPLDAITDEQIQTVYRARIDEYQRPETRRAFVIKVRTEALAKNLYDRVMAVDDPQERLLKLRRLSAKHTIDEQIKRSGGDVGFLPPADQTDAYIEVARRVFELDEIGAVTEPYAHDGAWVFVAMSDRKPARTRPLDAVREELRTEIYEERRRAAREDLVKDLREGAEVTIFEENLDGVTPNVPQDAFFDPATRKAPRTRGLKRPDMAPRETDAAR